MKVVKVSYPVVQVEVGWGPGTHKAAALMPVCDTVKGTCRDRPHLIARLDLG